MYKGIADQYPYWAQVVPFCYYHKFFICDKNIPAKEKALRQMTQKNLTHKLTHANCGGSTHFLTCFYYA